MWYEVCKECQILIENDEYQKMHDLLSNCEDGQDKEIVQTYMAFACYELGKIDEAIECWNKILDYKPHNPLAHFNMAACYALKGNLSECFKHYEYRLDLSYTSLLFSQRFKDRHWDGKAKGDVLYVYHEQGMGDLIQFLRFLPKTKQYFNKVAVEAPAEVASLLTEELGVDAIVVRTNEPLPITKIKCDYGVSLGSLPYLLGITKDTIDQGFPYIKPRVFENNFTKARPMRIDGEGLKIGACWRGSPNHLHDKYRSASLQDFEPLQKMKNVYNLTLHQSPFINLDFNNFQETANLIDQLDLVITVDTAVAHLAGAMGKLVWLFLRKRPDWRWGTGDTTHWYPKMRVIQDANINEHLSRFVETRDLG